LSDLPEKMKEEETLDMDRQFKKAYFNLFKKKYNAKFEKPDTLMTDKKKFSKKDDKKSSN
jgi:hypothetical protein